jgi:hypothetical protein
MSDDLVQIRGRMKLVNSLDHEIMYSLNKNKYLELKPQEFVFVPESVKNIYLKQTNDEYILSAEELAKYHIRSLVVGDIKAGYGPNSMVVSESIGYLRFLHTDFTGLGKRLYSSNFDVTDSEKTKVDNKKVTDKLSQMTNSNYGTFWWFVILIFALVICMLPVFAFVIVDFRS